MRHQKSRRRLSRFGSSRKALLKNLAISLLRYEKITTTSAKAKELRRLIDRLIKLGKKQDFNSKRYALKLLQDRESVEILFNDIALRFKDRNSGYTRIINFKNRRGDNASLVIIELAIMKPKEKKPIEQKKAKEAHKEESRDKKLQEEKITGEEIVKAPEGKIVSKIQDISDKKTEKPEEPGKDKSKKETKKPKDNKSQGFLEGIRTLFKRTKTDRKED